MTIEKIPAEFKCEQERAAFTAWLGRVADILDEPGPDDDAIKKLVGSGGDNGFEGQLAPDAEGFPTFYANTMDDPEKVDDLIYFLYERRSSPRRPKIRDQAGPKRG